MIGGLGGPGQKQSSHLVREVLNEMRGFKDPPSNILPVGNLECPEGWCQEGTMSGLQRGADEGMQTSLLGFGALL